MHPFLPLMCLVGLAFAAGCGRAPAAGIRPGFEAEVEALFAPLATGQELVDGWRFEGLSIDRARVVARLAGPGGARCTLALSELGVGPASWSSRDFAMAVDGVADPRAGAALQLLVARVQANDAGGHWARWGVVDAAVAAPERAAFLARVLTAAPTRTLALVLLLVVLVGRATSGEPLVRAGLVLVTVGGAALRSVMAPPALLAMQPLGRRHELTHALVAWPPFVGLQQLLDLAPRLTDLTFDVTFVFAVLGPLALFLLARHLLGDGRQALLAALVLAVLPLHLRFSRSDATFVPDLVMDALTLGLALVALRERSRWVAGLALAAVPLALDAALGLRPTNVLLLGLFPALALTPAWRDAGWVRRIAVGLVAPLLGVLLGWERSSFAEHSATPVPPAALRLLLESPFDWRRNTWIDPSITPFLVLVLVALGAVALWRARRGTLALLAGWFGALWGLNLVICSTTPEFHALYMLHTALPLLVVAGAAWPFLARLARLPRGLVLATLLASPVLHQAFVRDLAFNDLREHAFVQQTVGALPVGCTVLEYVGEKTGPEGGASAMRFAKLGARVQRGEVVTGVVPMGVAIPWRQRAPLDALIPPDVRALVLHPPACLYVYEGLLCQGEKDPSAPIAPFCAWVRERLPGLELVAEQRFPSRVYDSDQAAGLSAPTVRLALYRLRSAR